MLPIIFGAIVLAASAAYVFIQPPKPTEDETRQKILARLIQSGQARPSWGNQMPP
jgi:hypothetical protein